VSRFSVFGTNEKQHTTRNMFLDGQVGIQRYETVKYKQFDKFTEKTLGFFWRPEEVELTRDSKDFKELSEHEQHIFTSNLKRQTLLDSVQGRSPALAFMPIVSLPEVENWIETWAFNESIHSRSYTHIIRNIYSDPSKIFDELMDIKEIVDCSVDISKYYDDLVEYASWYNLLGYGTHTVNGKTITIDPFELKKKIWMAINSVNALEGIRFYISFASAWSFAELKKMEGNAKIIKFICRDENLHLGSTQTMLKLLVKEDSDFANIREECKSDVIDLFSSVATQEMQWADYLFKDGSIIGLNKQLLSDYIEWITHKRMISIGLPSIFAGGTNPLPWTEKWISGGEVQVAPQEVNLSSYIIGGTVRDLEDNTFKGFKL